MEKDTLGKSHKKIFVAILLSDKMDFKKKLFLGMGMMIV